MSAVRLVDGRKLSVGELASALALRQRVDLARDPHLPPTPEAELRAAFADDGTDFSRHDHVVAFDGDEAAAIGHLQLTNDRNNPELAEIEITAEGIADGASCAAPLLAGLLERARADRRRSIVIWDDHTPERHQFWTGLGAELRYTEQESDLWVGSVDAELMDRWIAASPAGLRLVRWTGSCPEEWLDAFTEVNNAMNDAPIDDLKIAAWVVDAEAVRNEIAAREACGYGHKVILAVDSRSGALVGATVVLVNRHRPGFSWQWSTVVLAAHRGRGVARRVKAEMWRWLRYSEPDVAMLRTGNAHSNTAILSINTQMGFRPSRSMGSWQVDLDTMAAALSSETAP